LVAPFWHEAKSKCTTNRKKKGTKKLNPRLWILLLFLLGRIYPIPVQGKNVKLQKLFKSECGCGMQALALIRAIFPLSHSGPVMLKSFHLLIPTKSDGSVRLDKSKTLPYETICVLMAHLRGILCEASYVTMCSERGFSKGFSPENSRNTFRSNLA